MKHILELIRPHQYIKNLFVLAPLFFVGQITNVDLLIRSILAFIAFSAVASSIYIVNDYFDLESDRQHPEKKNRPLPSGRISTTKAGLISIILAVSGLLLMFMLDATAAIIIGVYGLMNVAYSYKLKHIAILDVTIISVGFVLRIFIGSVVTAVPLSRWIVIITFLLAYFMALAKRRDDVLIFIETGKEMRKAIHGYSLQFLDTAMAIMASVVIVAYTIYTTSAEIVERFETEYLYLTALFVIVGIMRYLQIAFIHQESGSPTKIVLTDRFIQATLVGWLITFSLFLY